MTLKDVNTSHLYTSFTFHKHFPHSHVKCVLNNRDMQIHFGFLFHCYNSLERYPKKL